MTHICDINIKIYKFIYNIYYIINLKFRKDINTSNYKFKMILIISFFNKDY